MQHGCLLIFFIIPQGFGHIPVDIEFIIVNGLQGLSMSKAFIRNTRNLVGHKTSNTGILVINDREQTEEAR